MESAEEKVEESKRKTDYLDLHCKDELLKHQLQLDEAERSIKELK